MSDNGFKDYIEKRTVEQVMEDYSDQHDEWRRSYVSYDGDKKIFHHVNGNSFEIENCDDESMEVKPEIRFLLMSSSLEQQLERFFVTENMALYEAPRKETPYMQYEENGIRLSRYKDAKKLIIKDNVLAAVAVDTPDGIGILQPDRPLCISSDPEKYLYLCFC